MIKSRKLRHIVFLLALAVSPLGTVRISAQSQRAKEVGTHIKCLCKGCDMSAGGCAHPGGAFSGPCDTAIAELKEIDQHLAQGQTEQQIIEAFIAKYGTIAYVEPPKHGFGLLAWLMPVIYTVVGLAIAVFVVKKWASRKPVLAPAVPARSAASQEALTRARAQAARETED
jgi:cytochrome c-type biogenesis protein CcmH/NrfF